MGAGAGMQSIVGEARDDAGVSSRNKRVEHLAMEQNWRSALENASSLWHYQLVDRMRQVTRGIEPRMVQVMSRNLNGG